MKIVKTFESFQSKSEIDKICKNYGIRKYTINSDGSIDVDGNVDLYNEKLTKLPLNFNEVSGDFYCSNNILTSLEGCPRIVGGDFECEDNQLTSLKGCPTSVGFDFNCRTNRLKSLEGCPSEINGNFFCNGNRLKNMSNGPKSVGLFLYCGANQLETFEGFPDYASGLLCDYNYIYKIYELFKDYSKIELFNDLDIIRDNRVIILDRLNDFLDMCDKKPVTGVNGYTCI